MKRHPRYAVSVLLVVVLSGCTVGQTHNRLTSLPRGQGISVLISPPSGTVVRAYEVLAATIDGLYLRSLHLIGEGPLFLLPYERIGRAQFEGLRQLKFGGGQPPDGERLEQIRLMSRYPPGIDDELRQELLRAYEHDEIQSLD